MGFIYTSRWRIYPPHTRERWNSQISSDDHTSFHKDHGEKDRRVLLLNWLHCLASALAFLHSQGLAHRKIKPSNVMMDIDTTSSSTTVVFLPTIKPLMRRNPSIKSPMTMLPQNNGESDPLPHLPTITGPLREPKPQCTSSGNTARLYALGSTNSHLTNVICVLRHRNYVHYSFPSLASRPPKVRHLFPRLYFPRHRHGAHEATISIIFLA